MIYALNPKNYINYTNYMMQNKKKLKEHRKKKKKLNLYDAPPSFLIDSTMSPR